MKQLVYITGSGHSGSTLLDRLLGSHPDIAALGEIHRFSLGLHREEKPFRCDCGAMISDCAFWTEVFARVEQRLGLDAAALRDSFQTTDHGLLGQASGDNYFNAKTTYRFHPSQPHKYVLATTPKGLAPIFEWIGALGRQLHYARNSHILFEAVSEVSGASTIVDSTKNPMRMRSLHLTAPRAMKIIYLRRDGRAVTNSRMKRQSIGMEKAAKIWISENRKVRLVLRAMKGVEVLDVNYESLCGALGDEMARIFKFLDLPQLPVNLTTERHAIGGNPSRLNADKAVVVDEKWRIELTAEDLAIFNKVASVEQKR